MMREIYKTTEVGKVDIEPGVRRLSNLVLSFASVFVRLFLVRYNTERSKVTVPGGYLSSKPSYERIGEQNN